MTAAIQPIDAAALRDEMRTEAMRDLQRIIEITEEIFGRIVEIKNDYDPEYADDVWTALVVELEYSPESHRFEKELEWHKRRAELSTGWDSFRLSVRPKMPCDPKSS